MHIFPSTAAGPAPIQARVGGTAAAAAPTTAADATAAASGASPQAASAVEEKGKGGSSGGGGGDVGEELWIVGRILEDMDIRLGAKQEKLREFCLLFCAFFGMVFKWKHREDSSRAVSL